MVGTIFINGGINMITQADAKTAILEAWRVWPKGAKDKFSFDGRMFYTMLEQDKTFLLRFKNSASKWHVVKGWIQDHGY